MRHKWLKSFADKIELKCISIKEKNWHADIPKVIAWKKIKHSLFDKTKTVAFVMSHGIFVGPNENANGQKS